MILRVGVTRAIIKVNKPVIESTNVQTEALELLLELANELAFDMTFEVGDIQFLNSHVTYHSRTPLEDDKDIGHDRLLMRLWFAMPAAGHFHMITKCFGEMWRRGQCVGA